MMKQLLSAEFLKIKGKGFWLLSILGPLGVVGLQVVNYSVRMDYLLDQSDNDWEYYIQNVGSFIPIAMILGIVILTSFMASMEDETNAWKSLMALPVSRMSVYLSKFTVLAFLLLVSSILLLIFTLLYGVMLDFEESVPYVLLFEESFYPYLASLPVLALQLWLTTVSKNQGIPITFGVLGAIFAYSSYYLPDWMIWKWPSLMNQWNDPMINVCLGLGVGAILYIVGMFDFMRRDVK